MARLHLSTRNTRIDQTAIIGHPPESRDWPDDQPGLEPTIHPTARIEAFVTVDAGTTMRTNVGAGAWLQKHVHVGHDAFVAEDVEIATGTVIGGHAIICAGAHIGINATVLPFRVVGPDARVGAGAVVTHDIPADETWIGNPARKLEDHERDPRPHTQRASCAAPPPSPEDPTEGPRIEIG